MWLLMTLWMLGAPGVGAPGVGAPGGAAPGGAAPGEGTTAPEMAVTLRRITPVELTYQGQTFGVHGIDQIEFSGAHLFLRGLRETRVLRIDPDGNIQAVLGDKGSGPGEWGNEGIWAMGTLDDEVWGMRAEGGINGYDDLALLAAFRLDRPPHNPVLSSSRIAVSPRHLVVPTDDQSGHLAALVDKDGRLVKHFGEPLSLDEESMAFNRFANATIWTYADGRFYGLFLFYPLLLEVDAAAEQVRQIPLSHPHFQQLQTDLTKAEGRAYTGPAVFSDFQVQGDDLWLMSRGRLYRWSLAAGRCVGITRFYGQGAAFEQAAGKPLNLPRFAVLPSGTVLLAHPAQPWGAPLWSATLN